MIAGKNPLRSNVKRMGTPIWKTGFPSESPHPFAQAAFGSIVFPAIFLSIDAALRAGFLYRSCESILLEMPERPCYMSPPERTDPAEIVEH